MREESSLKEEAACDPQEERKHLQEKEELSFQGGASQQFTRTSC